MSSHPQSHQPPFHAYMYAGLSASPTHTRQLISPHRFVPISFQKVRRKSLVTPAGAIILRAYTRPPHSQQGIRLGLTVMSHA